jgi:hypothetical protein
MALALPLLNCGFPQLSDTRMQDPLQAPTRLWIGKDSSAKFLPLENTSFIEHSLTKSFNNFGQGWFSWLHHLPRQLISVDYWKPPLKEKTSTS